MVSYKHTCRSRGKIYDLPLARNNVNKSTSKLPVVFFHLDLTYLANLHANVHNDCNCSTPFVLTKMIDYS